MRSAAGRVAGLLLLIALGSVSCHHPVKVTVRERAYYGLPPDAADGDAFCVPSEQAGDPILCVSVAQIRAYVRQARYAP